MSPRTDSPGEANVVDAGLCFSALDTRTRRSVFHRAPHRTSLKREQHTSRLGEKEEKRCQKNSRDAFACRDNKEYNTRYRNIHIHTVLPSTSYDKRERAETMYDWGKLRTCDAIARLYDHGQEIKSWEEEGTDMLYAEYKRKAENVIVGGMAAKLL